MARSRQHQAISQLIVDFRLKRMKKLFLIAIFLVCCMTGMFFEIIDWR